MCVSVCLCTYACRGGGGSCGRVCAVAEITALSFSFSLTLFLRWDNGPQGFGDGTKPGTTTQWSSCLNIGATMDPELAREWGRAMGEEFWNKGTNIQEGPGTQVVIRISYKCAVCVHNSHSRT
jgi:hypothetical protein